MNFQIVRPSGALKNWVKQYCFMESDPNDDNIMERVIPMDYIQLMFHYRNPFLVHNSSPVAVQQPRIIISGLSNTYSDVSTNGEAGVVFVSFYPTGASHFFGFPLDEIENGSYDLSEIFHAEVRQVEEELFLVGSVVDRVAVIEKFLMKKYSPVITLDDQLVNKGVEYIKMAKGQISASLLSEKLSVTPKSLERKFSRNLGKTPKQYIKLIRFQETLKDFSGDKGLNLTEYAYKNGYFDQSHFIKDFKSYCGYTPKEFAVKYPDFNVNGDYC